MFRLFEIESQIERLFATEVDENGEITEEGLKALEDLELNKETKVLNTAKLIKSYLSEADAVKASEAVLSQRRKTLERKAERLKKYITDHAGGEDYRDSEISVSWRKSFKLPDEIPLDIVPDEFKRIEFKVDKVALTKAIKEGSCLAVSLIQNNNIQIK
jgi:hypothetical protein